MFNEDFSEFLYSRGINRFEWRLLLDYSSDEALNILGKYSEQTFEKVMKTVRFLERRTISTIELISCSEEEMVSILLVLQTRSKIKLLEISSLKRMTNINIFHSSQISSKYLKSREKDIFTLIESGYKVVSNELFNHVQSLRKTQLN